MQRTAHIKLPAGTLAQPLIEFLVTRFTYHTREEWVAVIERQHLLLNNERTTPSMLLAAHDQITYCIPDTPEPPVDLFYTPLYEDAELLVVNKPGNLPCHPAGRYFNHTLWALLKRDGYGEAALHLVHRLDRETSGIVVIAKSASAAAALSNQFASRTVDKHYQVFVEGAFPETYAAIGYLETDTQSQIRKKRRFVEAPPLTSASLCETSFICNQQHAGLSLLTAHPKTGHLHQIRATLCSLGYPIVGDKLYGVNEQFFLDFLADQLTPDAWQRLRLPRQALHAQQLRLRHPATHTWMEFEAPLAHDMATLLTTVRPA